MSEKSVTVSKIITLNVPRQALWLFLSDTDRLNKAVGLPAIEFLPHPDPDKKGYYAARTRVLGISIRYEELPYDWVEGQYYRIIRKFSLPFMHEIGTSFIFRTVPEGTELELEIHVAPKSILTTIICKVILAKLAFKDVFRMAREFEKKYKNLGGNEPTAYETIYEIKTKQLEARFHDLALFNPDKTILEHLKQHLLKGSDVDVVRMRPFEIAGRWNTDRFETLKTFITATKAGILDLHWTVLCPNCRSISSDALTLADLKKETHCDTCDINYGADLTASIEARFTVHPSIRLARHETYCIGGPANMPQILSQIRIPPSSKHVEKLELHEGIIRVRSFQTEGIRPVYVNEDSVNTTLSVKCDQAVLTLPENDVQSGIVPIEFINQMPEEILVIVERESWRDNAATAAIVTSMQEFRDLFPSEAVAPGTELGIGSIAILFTDLRGSTALYRNIGDTRAFEFVQNHFRYLTESVSKHHGGILKTMGDAIMASFAVGFDALSAAIEMQTEWMKFCKEYGDYADIALKIGIHEGGAIAINNKGRLDYFGTTVNIAGRLQKFSRGGDIIISEALLAHPDIQNLFAVTPSLTFENFPAELKGLEQSHYQLRRIIVG